MFVLTKDIFFVFCTYVTYTQLKYQIMETDGKCKVTPDGVAIHNC